MSIKPPTRKWRALIDLAYSDIIPEMAGKPLAKAGDITELYPELLEFPDRLKLLEDLHFIEPVPETAIVKPSKANKDSEENI